MSTLESIVTTQGYLSEQTIRKQLEEGSQKPRKFVWKYRKTQLIVENKAQRDKWRQTQETQNNSKHVRLAQ